MGPLAQLTSILPTFEQPHVRRQPQHAGAAGKASCPRPWQIHVMRTHSDSQAPWWVLLFGGLFLAWELFLIAALPRLTPSSRILLSLLGVAFLPLMAYGFARQSGGSAFRPTEVRRDIHTVRARHERRYLRIALSFGSVYLIWWIVGLFALPPDAFTNAQKIAWGVIGIPSLLLGAHGLARYWHG